MERNWHLDRTFEIDGKEYELLPVFAATADPTRMDTVYLAYAGAYMIRQKTTSVIYGGEGVAT